jgi:hypothetical protein
VELRRETFGVLGEPVSVEGYVRVCGGCDRPVFDEALDDALLLLAYAIYRQRRGIPDTCPPPYRMVKGEGSRYRRVCPTHGEACPNTERAKGGGG